MRWSKRVLGQFFCGLSSTITRSTDCLYHTLVEVTFRSKNTQAIQKDCIFMHFLMLQYQPAPSLTSMLAPKHDLSRCCRHGALSQRILSPVPGHSDPLRTSLREQQGSCCGTFTECLGRSADGLLWGATKQLIERLGEWLPRTMACLTWL